MTTRSLADLTATEAAAKLQAGEITAVAMVEACLDRIAERDADVQAWAYLDPDRALAQARERDALRASGARIGPLHGLPVGVKDIIDTADMPTENGSAHFVGHRPEQDAAVVAQLRASGAVIMGKTVTTELATLTPGKTRNPHNPEHTPGGSSSGSAAAVATGMVPLALGTQTGGSVVRPASFCGIHGLKPTLGLVSRTGVTLQSHTLDTVGVYGRSIADLALITQALDVPDPTDAVSYARSRSAIVDEAAKTPALQPKLAFLRTPAWPEASDGAKQAISSLVDRLGLSEATLAPVFDAAVDLHKIVQAAENGHHFARLYDKDPTRFSDGLREKIEAGRRVPAFAYLDAIDRRAPLYEIVKAGLDANDAFVCLSATGPAPVTLKSTGNPIFNGLWTYLGVPTVTLPLLTVDGLPLGVTLVGKRREEGKLLACAAWLEARLAG